MKIVHLYKDGLPQELDREMQRIDPKKREEAFFNWVKMMNEIDIFITV